MNAGGTGLGFPSLLSLNAMNGLSKLFDYSHVILNKSGMTAPHSGSTCFRRKIRDKRPVECRTIAACGGEEQYPSYSGGN